MSNEGIQPPPFGNPLTSKDGYVTDERWKSYLLATQRALDINTAPSNARYFVAETDGALTDEVNLGLLASGFLQITTALGMATPSTVTTIPASILTGPTLAAAVTASSLTSVGTLTALSVTGVVSGMSDIYTTNWTDYSGMSTIVGWSAFTTKSIFYKTVGRLVFVQYNLSGTSNSISASFTLPVAMNNSVELDNPIGVAFDNGSALTKTGVARIVVGTPSTVTLYPDQTLATAWTNAGTKITIGQFWYESV